MGLKRELALRRCASMVDDADQASEILRRRACAASLITPETNPCPVAIRIDACSDDEEESSAGKGQTIKSPARPILAEPKPLTSQFCNGSPKFPSVSVSPNLSRKFLEPPDGSDLALLKATAIRLKLKTRRSSFLEWQASNSRAPPTLAPPSDKLTSARMERISEALEWLKSELTEMRSVDQHLARQLLSLRHDMHQLRLSRSCQQHRALLDDVQLELEEQVAFSDILDLPAVTLNDTPLKQLGVTRMNLSARRFSTC